MKIFKEFSFQASHRLPNVPAGHKCGRLHGHSYSVQIHVAGTADGVTGWIVDFAYVAEAFAPILQRLDHSHLNEVIDNPTSENLARWIWAELAPRLAGLCRVVVQETPSSGCEYDGPGSNIPARLAAAVSLLHEVHDRGAQKMDTQQRIGAFLADESA